MKQIKQKLEEEYDERYNAYLDFLFEAKEMVKRSPITGQLKKSILKQLVMDDLLDNQK